MDQSKVKLYIGLPAYKIGSVFYWETTKAEKAELKNAKTLKKMFKYAVEEERRWNYCFLIMPILDKAAAINWENT